MRTPATLSLFTWRADHDNCRQHPVEIASAHPSQKLEWIDQAKWTDIKRQTHRQKEILKDVQEDKHATINFLLEQMPVYICRPQVYRNSWLQQTIILLGITLHWIEVFEIRSNPQEKVSKTAAVSSVMIRPQTVFLTLHYSLMIYKTTSSPVICRSFLGSSLWAQYQYILYFNLIRSEGTRETIIFWNVQQWKTFVWNLIQICPWTEYISMRYADDCLLISRPS